jgi:cathepsin L
LYDEWQYVNENNKLFKDGKSDFFSEIYPFSYLDDEEFANRYLGLVEKKLKIAEGFQLPPPIKSRVPVGPKIVPPECQNLPIYKNWATEGKLAPVKYQDQCGSCYLFAGIEVLESYRAIESGDPVEKLSTQNTLECVKDFDPKKPMRDACKGGYPQEIWKYARDEMGLVAEAYYDKYNANPNGTCVSDLMRDSNTEVDYWRQIPEGDEEAMKCHLATVGPLSILMIVINTSFVPYSFGIWDDPENNCTADRSVDHVSCKSFLD